MVSDLFAQPETANVEVRSNKRIFLYLTMSLIITLKSKLVYIKEDIFKCYMLPERSVSCLHTCCILNIDTRFRSGDQYGVSPIFDEILQKHSEKSGSKNLYNITMKNVYKEHIIQFFIYRTGVNIK